MNARNSSSGSALLPRESIVRRKSIPTERLKIPSLANLVNASASNISDHLYE